jgi:hypothetical protein
MRNYLFLIVLFSIVACDQFKGPTGPQGLNGIQGESYSDNASIINFKFDKDDLTISDQLAIYQVNIPEITQEIVDNGVVIVYKLSGAKWQAMPFSMPIDVGEMLSVDYVLDVGYFYETGLLSIVQTSSLKPAMISLCIDGSFKVVVLP